jgi:uncharacterized protein YidB (DUF937 family)
MSVSEGTAGDLGEAAAGLPPDLQNHLTALLNDPQVGGVSGLAQAFYAAGLGRMMASWIGPGPNQPISPPQVQRVLGATRLEQLAAKLGTTTGRVSVAVATALPSLIDTLTPNGQLPPWPLP